MTPNAPQSGDETAGQPRELAVEHDLGPLVGPGGRGLVVGGAVHAEPVVGAVVDLGLALGQGVRRLDERGVGRGGLHGVGRAEPDVQRTGVGRHGEVGRVAVVGGAERRVQSDTGPELPTMVAEGAQHRPRTDAVADAAHRTAPGGRVGRQPRKQGGEILGDVVLGRAEHQAEHLLDLVVVAALHRVPRLGSVVAVVGHHVVAPLGDAGHRLLRSLVEPGAVMEEHDDRERAVAVGPYDMDAHRAARRRDLFGARVHPATLVRANAAATIGLRGEQFVGSGPAPAHETPATSGQRTGPGRSPASMAICTAPLREDVPSRR